MSAAGACALSILTGVFFAKPMNRMGLTSFPDYYRLRFGRQVEVAASVMLIVGFCILVAGNLVAGGFLFNYFLGIPYWLGTVIIAVLAVAYTGTGGLLADAYTAIIQMTLVLVGAVGLLIWMAVTHGIVMADGMGPLALEQMTDPAMGATVNWATLIALGIGDIVAIDFMQRVFAAKSPEAARRPASPPPRVPWPSACRSVWLCWRHRRSCLPNSTALCCSSCSTSTRRSGLTILVLCGLVGASMCTANGAILAISNVCVRNAACRDRSARQRIRCCGPPGSRWCR